SGVRPSRSRDAASRPNGSSVRGGQREIASRACCSAAATFALVQDEREVRLDARAPGREIPCGRIERVVGPPLEIAQLHGEEMERAERGERGARCDARLDGGAGGGRTRAQRHAQQSLPVQARPAEQPDVGRKEEKNK